MESKYKKVILENKIIDRVIEQQIKGLQKYGETVNPDSHNISGWLEHLLQELTDAIVYVETIKAKLENCQCGETE